MAVGFSSLFGKPRWNGAAWRRLGLRWLLMSLSLIPGVHAAPAEVELGWAYFKGQNYDQAALQFRKAIDAFPDLAEPYTGLGWTLYWKGEYIKAEEAFRKALARDAKDASANEGLAAVSKWRYADFNAGWNAYYAGHYADSLKIFQSMIKDETSRLPAEDLWQAHSGLGWSAYALQSYELAEQSFKRILAIAPTNAYALKGLGFTCYQTGRPKEAIEFLSKALKSNPEWGDVISMQGWCYYSSKDYDNALERFQASISVNPFLADPYYGRGWTLFRQDKPGDAKEAFREGITRGPAHPSARDLFALIDKRQDWWDLYSLYGWAYYKAGFFIDAENTFRYGITKLPKDASLYCGLGYSVFRIGRHKEALDHLTQALALQPDLPPVQETFWKPEGAQSTVSSDARSTSAWARYYLQDYANALNDFRTTLKDHPNWALSHSGLGWTLLRLGKAKDAEEAFQQALKLDPALGDAQAGLNEVRKDRYAKFNEAWSAYYAGDVEKAAKLFTELASAKDSPVDSADQWKIFSGLGWSELGRKRPGAARPAFDKAMKLSPNNPYASKGLVFCAQDEGRLDEAIKAGHEWLKTFGEDADLRVRMGQALLKAGKPSEAAASFDQALLLTPGSSAALQGLADAYTAMKQEEKAAIYREAASRLQKAAVPSAGKQTP